MNECNATSQEACRHQPPRHGGDLQAFLSQHNIGHDLLDLSCATNRYAYPRRETSSASWSALPYINEDIVSIIEHYYGTKHIRLIPGSQWAIEQLPLLIEMLGGTNKPVELLLPELGYSEHEHHWRKRKAMVRTYDELPSIEQLGSCNVLVVINPNNPSGVFISPARLIEIADQMQRKGGWLIVDEAFIDFHPEYSLMPLLGASKASNVIVLRSFGKFSGLPGARLGVIGASPMVCSQLDEIAPLWGISGPSLEIMLRALSDKAWYESVKKKLALQANKLAALLNENFDHVKSEVLLFQTVFSKDAQLWFNALVREGVYPRLLDCCSGMRFSIPKQGEEFEQLALAFRRIKDRGLRCYK